MSVKTSKLFLNNNMEETEKKVCCHFRHFKTGNFYHKLMCTFLGIFLVYSIVLVAVVIRNEIKKYNNIGLAPRNERSILVDAVGKVTVKPDIAVTTMGVTANDKTVAEAQRLNTETMNKLTAKLKELGIVEEDIQTVNYNIYPKYIYPINGGPEKIDGYQVDQNVKVKIRDLQKANQVLALAGEVGANTVSGLQFTIDDREVYKEQAREKALEKVWQKISKLSDSLGVRVVSVVSYNEYEANPSDGAVYDRGMAYSSGYGVSPDLQAGVNEVSMNVQVTFEIR